MDPNGPLSGGVMVVRSQQDEDATFSLPKLQVQLAPPLPVQNMDMDSTQQENFRLRNELQAVSKERDAAHDRVDAVLHDLIALQIELEEEVKASMYKDDQIKQLKEDILRLSERFDERNHEISGLTRDQDQQKPLSTEAPRIPSLENSVESGPEFKKSGADMQHDTKAELKAKDMELQERSKTMTELEFQHESDMRKLQEQLDQAQATCLETQRKWEAAETQVKVLQEAKLEALQEAALLQSSQADDVVNMKRLLEFYQANAASVSKRAKETMNSNKQLEALIVAKDKQLDEQMSLIMTIRQHTDTQKADTEQPTIPGSFC